MYVTAVNEEFISLPFHLNLENMHLLFSFSLLCGMLVKAEFKDNAGLIAAEELASFAESLETLSARIPEEPRISYREAPSKRIIRGLLEVRQGCDEGIFKQSLLFMGDVFTSG